MIKTDTETAAAPKIPVSSAMLERIVFWALLTAGALLRMWYLWDYSGSPLFDLPLGADVAEYFARARGFIAGRIFPATPDIHAPLYPAFLALLLILGGGSLPLVRTGQLALNYGAWIALYMLFKRMGIPRKVRLLFLGFAMLFPVPFFYQSELVSESLLLPAAALSFWMLHLADTGKTPFRRNAGAVAAGVALGMMNLIHPLTLLFTAAEVALPFLRRKYMHGVLILTAATTIIGGFCAAQSLHYGRLCGIQGNSGFNFFLGNNPSANGSCYLRPGRAWRKLHREAAREAARRGIAKDTVFWGRALDFWTAHPGRALALWGRKALGVFSPSERQSGSDVPPLLCFTDAVFYGRMFTPLLFLLAGFGLWCIFRRKPQGMFIHCLLLFFAVYTAQIVTVTSGRYRLLMMFPIMLFAAVGANEFNWRRWWFVPLLLLFGCGLFTITDYGGTREEATALYAEAAIRNGRFQFADDLAGYSERAPRQFDPAHIANLRGVAAEGMGDLVRARDYYLKATRIEPELPHSWMNLGNLAAAAGEFDRAEKFYTRAFQLEPRPNELGYNYARYRFVSGQPCAEAVAAALEADPASARTWNLAGMFAMREKDFTRAAECFAKAAKFAPETMQDAYLNNRRIAIENLRGSR
jgi:tetratricopeptide (TPR) repeat protein